MMVLSGGEGAAADREPGPGPSGGAGGAGGNFGIGTVGTEGRSTTWTIAKMVRGEAANQKKKDIMKLFIMMLDGTKRRIGTYSIFTVG
jgi:hypothetical protein